jgi:hypothetical protein
MLDFHWRSARVIEEVLKGLADSDAKPATDQTWQDQERPTNRNRHRATSNRVLTVTETLEKKRLQCLIAFNVQGSVPGVTEKIARQSWLTI